MRNFKFLNKPKRPVLDVIFREWDLELLKLYCNDLYGNLTHHTNNDLSYYYSWIGLVEKTFNDGKLAKFTINYYKENQRIMINISVLGDGTSFIIDSVTKYNQYDNVSAVYYYPNEEL